MALSWVVFLLGHHPEIQEKVWPEIDALFDELEQDAGVGGQVIITLDKVKELKYLECIVKEGLRLCPSVPFVGRKAHEDMKLKTSEGHEYVIPTGTIIYVMIYMLHRDPEIYRQVCRNISSITDAYRPHTAGKVRAGSFSGKHTAENASVLKVLQLLILIAVFDSPKIVPVAIRSLSCRSQRGMHTQNSRGRAALIISLCSTRTTGLETALGSGLHFRN